MDKIWKYQLIEIMLRTPSRKLSVPEQGLHLKVMKYINWQTSPTTPLMLFFYFFFFYQDFCHSIILAVFRKTFFLKKDIKV